MSHNGERKSVELQKNENQRNQPNQEIQKNKPSNQVSRTKEEDDFELLKVLGKGGYGKVFQVKEKETAKIFAMKVILKKSICHDPRKVRHTFTELEVLTSHTSPFLCDLKYAFQSDSKLFLVMPFFAGGDLFSLIGRERRISEQDAKFYLAQVVLGVEKLHQLEVIYRDLKPDNVLLDNRGHCKLADFGLAKRISTGQKAYTCCGTPDYMSPEMIEEKGHSYEVDWWAVGILFFDLITGFPPFYSQSGNEAETKKLAVEGNVDYPCYVSPEARQLLRQLLRKTPGYRISGDGVKAHRFFTGFNWETTESMAAPFVPELVTESSTAMFETEFTNQQAVHDETAPVGEEEQNRFFGFEYTG